MELVSFPESPKEVARLLKGSKYLEDLCKRRQEQEVKNGKVFDNIDELINFYAISSAVIDDEDQCIIRNVLCFMYSVYPCLPKVDKIHFVVINPEAPLLEFGNTSFTINNVVFMLSAVVDDPETIMHETMHVLQRTNDEWFNRFCQRLGFSQVTPSVLYDLVRNKNTILNPDADANMLYADPTEVVVVYNSEIKPVFVNLLTGSVDAVQNGGSCELLGAQMRPDSVSEMMAIRYSKKQYIQNRRLLAIANDMLEEGNNPSLMPSWLALLGFYFFYRVFNS